MTPCPAAASLASSDSSRFRILTDDRPEPHDFDYTFVSFADQFGPVGLCIGPPSQHMTIPADFLEAMPPGGVVQVGVLNPDSHPCAAVHR